MDTLQQETIMDTLQQQVVLNKERNIGPFIILKKAHNKQCFTEQQQSRIIDAFEPQVIYLPETSQTTKTGPYRTLKKAFKKQCYCTNKQLILTCNIFWPFFVCCLTTFDVLPCKELVA